MVGGGAAVGRAVAAPDVAAPGAAAQVHPPRQDWSGGVAGGPGDLARLATGKLSDVAGVALLALLLGGLTGRTAPVVGVSLVALVAPVFLARRPVRRPPPPPPGDPPGYPPSW